ncbi:uncharacterized protein BCR38DRAFT_406833 [Pseudomassariella vexata]|uniref:Uncharacterized protein n=1 Tax=Pseudomassariella vexata TaxID=1141098 RepID=A0A1Y2ECI4_9PEZI|nr:uncharacterized protein BCR38DRAFT_406833 [Pseudomassariella vexata]ORY68956.1 hypothetical protein BCR38DRAFT_406833 [Pseudomassariella vexata]
MPTVNLPVQHARGNVTLSSSQLQLIFNVAVASVMLFSAFALHLVIRSRKHAFYAPKLAGLSVPGAIREHHRYLRVPEKSRGVSNDTTLAMPAKPETETHQLGTDSDTVQINTGGTRRGSQDGLDKFRRDVVGTTGNDATVPRSLKSQPPPPPPLTPPALSTAVFMFEERRSSSSVSVIGDLDTNFFQQPNPDYTSPMSSTSTALPPSHGSPTAPRRRSYTKMLPLGPPQPISTSELDSHAPPFAPSSFPPSSPILPLAPHTAFNQREIDVHGEIISVMDDAGAGWKRHTRVYSGGVCLACQASGGEGGFYGDRVRPEERR